MTNQEVIRHRVAQDDEFRQIVQNAVEYAVLSLPFTIDRMGLSDAQYQITNIAKGKIAENYFEHFCRKRNLAVDFAACTTPFWQVDKRDFIFQGKEWDLKNNFVYHDGRFQSYVNLPALVPNKHGGDQWSSRNSTLHPHTTGGNFLFTFMKGAPLIGNRRGAYFFDINLTSNQLSLIIDLIDKYKGLPQPQQPYPEQKFWKEFHRRGANTDLFTLRFIPELIITGYSSSTEWHLFEDTGPFSSDNYVEYTGRWYQKLGGKNSLKFLNGELWTTITNATSPIEYLPAFSSLF